MDANGLLTSLSWLDLSCHAGRGPCAAYIGPSSAADCVDLAMPHVADENDPIDLDLPGPHYAL